MTMSNSPVLTGLARQLVLAELIDETTAGRAVQQAQRNQIPLVTYLVQNKLVNSTALASQAAEQFGVPYFDLSALDKDQQPKDLISEKLARQHRALPLWKRGNKLYIGMSDPTLQQAVTDIQFSTGLNTELVLVQDDRLDAAIDRYFESDNKTMEGLGDIDLEDGLEIESGDQEREDNSTGGDADDAPVVKFVNKMLLDAIKGGSSDLHFEPYEKVYRVRFRTDGVLHEVAKPPFNWPPAFRHA